MRSVSQTALMVAAYRARATARGDGLCDDPWAAALAGDDGRTLARDYEPVYAHLELWIALRTGAIDAEVRAQLDAGVRQIVVLGAGLDTRAARLAREGARFFEVDEPATQAEKRRRTAALAGYPVDAATYVACDFEADDFLERLAAHGFRADVPALFVWEGVSYYLPEAAVRATLGRVAAGTDARSAIVFDYVRKKFVHGELRDAKDAEARAHVAKLGEPFRFGTDDVLPLLYEAGFRHVRTASFDELCLTRTGTYERERKFRFQRLAFASRTPPSAR